ncbi:MAG: DNA gyrase subunit A [Chloroflexota bacterium]|nr:DNA gyrase subunit A [Chloroflexota bacterium]
MTTSETIRPIRLVDEMRSSYLDYAMSVIVARALPDVRDGLKPVHRRILYSMDELTMRPGQPYKKSARLVGEVLGKYHPHGDGPVYDAMVRLAQDFSMRYPLIDGQGNFGSVDNDPPAAMRYTEARLSPIAMEMLGNIDQDTVNFAPNFDGSLQEPTVLPTRLPNLIVNGTSGIAVGMTTSIPPHNLAEVCDAIVHLVNNPAADIEDLMTFIKGPDFPTSAIILGQDGIREAYHTGHGRVVVRSKMEVEEVRGNRFRLVITEIPFQVNKAALVEKIATLAKERRIDGISDIRDESDRNGLTVVIELARNAQVQVVRNNLWKHTALQSSFYINMLALVDGQPQVLNLRQILQHYIDFRVVVIRRRTAFEIRRAQARVHLLEGLRTALNHLDPIIQLIRNSDDTDIARTELMQTYSLDDVQAQAILEMQLRRLAALERQRIEDEYQDLTQKIADWQSLLDDSSKVNALIIEETTTLKEKYGTGRRTDFSSESPDGSTDEELIPNEDMVITRSQRGYIKSIPFDTYKRQHRGGKGVRGQTTREDDSLAELLIADTHDTVLFFTNRGRVFKTKVYQLQKESSRTTRGTHLVQYLRLKQEQNESVQTMLVMSQLEQDKNLLFATQLGEIKRMKLSSVTNIRANGLNAMDIEPGDELVSVRIAEDEDDVLMVSRDGLSIRFAVTDVRASSRIAGGVRGMRLRPSDLVVAMDIVVPGHQLLVISERGLGKPTILTSYKRQSRSGYGLRTFRITSKSGPVATAKIVREAEDLLIVSERGQVTRTSITEIRGRGRLTTGVSIVSLAENDRVVAIASLDPKERTPNDNPSSYVTIDGGTDIDIDTVSTNGHQQLNGSSETIET